MILIKIYLSSCQFYSMATYSVALRSNFVSIWPWTTLLFGYPVLMEPDVHVHWCHSSWRVRLIGTLFHSSSHKEKMCVFFIKLFFITQINNIQLQGMNMWLNNLRFHWGQGLTLTFQLTSLVASDTSDITNQKNFFLAKRFSLRLPRENIETQRRHCKNCWDFFTDRHCGNVSKAKQLSE